jgi:hypothetical protein
VALQLDGVRGVRRGGAAAGHHPADPATAAAALSAAVTAAGRLQQPQPPGGGAQRRPLSATLQPALRRLRLGRRRVHRAVQTWRRRRHRRHVVPRPHRLQRRLHPARGSPRSCAPQMETVSEFIFILTLQILFCILHQDHNDFFLNIMNAQHSSKLLENFPLCSRCLNKLLLVELLLKCHHI